MTLTTLSRRFQAPIRSLREHNGVTIRPERTPVRPPTVIDRLARRCTQPCTQPVAVTHPCGFHGCHREATDKWRGIGVCRGHMFIAMERAMVDA